MNNGDALYSAQADDLGEPFDMRTQVVELGASHRHGLSLEQVLVQARITQGTAIGHEEQFRTLQIRRLRMDELELYRKMREG